MLHYYRTNPGMRTEVRAFVLMLLLAAGFVVVAIYRSDVIREDVVVYEAVCRELSANSTTGRQALVSSVWWAPLPFLLRWPFAVLSSAAGAPVASFVIAALFGSASLFLVEKVLRRVRLGWWRFLIVIGICLHPHYLSACTDGSSSTTVLFFTLLSAAGMAEWMATRLLRHLVRFAYAATLLCGVSAELAVWLLVPLAALCVDMLLRARAAREREATFIVALLPLLYGVGLWILLNWLIMGDGLFFVRSIGSEYCRRYAARVGVGGVPIEDMALAGAALVITVLCALCRCRGGAGMGLFAAAPLALALALRTVGAFWSREPVLFVLFPLVCLAAGYAGARTGGFVGRLRGLLALLALAGGMWFWIQEGGVSDPAARGADVVSERCEDVPARVARHVLSMSRYPKVFVCGYEGFILMRGYDDSGIFQHALDFDFERAETEYPLRDLFILVRRPAGRGAMQSVHWKYDELFYLGDRNALIDDDWGDWRLFEIVQAPKRKL